MKKLLLILLVIASAVFFACNKTTDDQTGRLVVKITDAPFPVEDIEYANVTINKVELRKVCDGICDGTGEGPGEGICDGTGEGPGEGICDAYPFVVVSEEPVTVNLLDLRNGVTELLADIDLPQGSYDLVRLYIEEASLKVIDGEEHIVKVPSGDKTGIKIFIQPSLLIEGGVTSELLLDFDLSRSFILRGNPNSPAGINGFIFKPVIRTANMSVAGRIEGSVSDTAEALIENAEVWITQDTVVATAFTGEDGKYAFIGVPAGLYSVYATGENYDTISYDDVRVVEGNRTIQDFILTGN